MVPASPAPHPRDPETTSSPTPNGTSEALDDMDPVVSKWLQLASMDRQSLAPMDQQSFSFLCLLWFLVKEGDHAPTVKLQDNDARIALGVLVEVRSSLATERG